MDGPGPHACTSFPTPPSRGQLRGLLHGRYEPGPFAAVGNAIELRRALCLGIRIVRDCTGGALELSLVTASRDGLVFARL